MPTDAVIVSVANYPRSNHLLRALPGAAHDRLRMQNWLESSGKGVSIKNFSWPPVLPAVAAATDAGDADVEPWNRLSIEATMQQLLASGLNKTRDRLFFYASAHGLSAPSSPAMPAV